MTQNLHHLIRKTPVEYSPQLTRILGQPTYLKLENLQITGSFKIRGALMRLSQNPRADQIISCSAGNHGKAVAFISQKLGIRATIYAPKQADESKLIGIKSYGAQVIRSDYLGYDDTENYAKKIAQETNCPFISPFDDPLIMAGNGGTLATEILRQVPALKTVITPVGGGGLAAGLCTVLPKEIQLIGCQHKDSPALHLSLQRGKAVTSLPAIETVAGGVEGGIGESCFKIIQKRISAYHLVSEEEIFHAFQWFLEHHQYLIEPTSAIVIAAALLGKLKIKQGPAVIIITGRNVCYQTIQKLTFSPQVTPIEASTLKPAG